jgi:hypothetical protein
MTQTNLEIAGSARFFRSLLAFLMFFDTLRRGFGSIQFRPQEENKAKVEFAKS